MNKYLEALWDLLFPPQCLVCGGPMVFLCETCLARIRAKISIKESRVSGLEKVLSLMDYADPIKHLIWLCKFRNKKVLLPLIAKLIADAFTEELKNIDMIVPVPIHPHKLKQRGFNQAEELIRTTAECNHIPLLINVLSRQAETHALYDLNRTERGQMIRGSMSCTSPGNVKGKTILLFDDIVTTGATLRECARLLREHGSGKILGLTICKA
jgi:competence protein ComFC